MFEVNNKSSTHFHFKKSKDPVPVLDDAISDDKVGIVLYLNTIQAIKENKLKTAKAMLNEVIAYNLENPEVYNLLGIIYEIEGDIVKAARFYRVSYYMNQAFLAPFENLKRVCDFCYKSSRDFSWGITYKKG